MNKYKELSILFNIVSLIVTPFIIAVPGYLTPYFVATATATNAVALFCNTISKEPETIP